MLSNSQRRASMANDPIRNDAHVVLDYRDGGRGLSEEPRRTDFRDFFTGAFFRTVDLALPFEGVPPIGPESRFCCPACLRAVISSIMAMIRTARPV